MTDFRPLDKRGARRRRAILEAALQLFSEQGFDRVSVRAISQLAGASTETIYRHFGDKEGLLKAVASLISQQMTERDDAEEAFDPTAPPDIVLGRTGREFLNILLMPESLGFFRLVMQQSTQSNAMAKAFWEGGPAQTSERLATYLARQKKNAVLDLVDPALAAEQFFGMLHGTLHMRVLLGLEKPTRATIDRYVDNAVQIFLDGCRKGP